MYQSAEAERQLVSTLHDAIVSVSLMVLVSFVILLDWDMLKPKEKTDASRVRPTYQLATLKAVIPLSRLNSKSIMNGTEKA